MEITVELFKSRFIEVFGDRCWGKFNKKFRTNAEAAEGFRTMEEIVAHLQKYVKHITQVKNFYNSNNKQFLRFILICIERKMRPESMKIDFSAKHTPDSINEMEYEVEHIIPKSEFSERVMDPNFERKHKHNLSNLTLISRDLNNDEAYKVAIFDRKRELIRGHEDGSLYINQIFQEIAIIDEKLPELLENRNNSLKEEFGNIFYHGEKWNDDSFFYDSFFKDILQFSDLCLSDWSLLKENC